MAKLTGAKKAAFLARMAKGRKKAKRKAPARKAARKNPARKTATKGKLRGAKKLEFLARMAKGRKKAKKNPGPRRRRNSDQEAESKFEEFHQKPPRRMVEVETVYQYPQHYAELGKLIELRFDLDPENEDFPLTSFRGTLAVCTPDGANIYFIGGDQGVDFNALALVSDKDFVTLGSCTYIAYQTVKGFHDFKDTEYVHEFGEDDGILPDLVYDTLNRGLFLSGGNYRVRREGIVN